MPERFHPLMPVMIPRHQIQMIDKDWGPYNMNEFAQKQLKSHFYDNFATSYF